MPDPKRDETEKGYMSRCMASSKTNKDFPDQKQRYAFCATQWKSKGNKTNKYIEAAEEYSALGFTEELTADNFVVPQEKDYVDFGEASEDWDIAEAKPGLWENIRKKKEREGKNYKPAKKGDPDRPDPEAWKKAQKKKKKSDAAEYQGRKVKLGKPFRTPDGPKKFSVYVKNDKGNVVKVNFGDPNMEIKKDNPARRKSFRARHKCDTAPGPRWKARYWSCKMW